MSLSNSEQYFPLCDRRRLENGSKTEGVTAPHSGASRPEHHLQPSYGGYRLSHGKVRLSLARLFLVFFLCSRHVAEWSFIKRCYVSFHNVPRYKMSGKLPLLSLRISDYKFRNVLALVESIPLPKSRPAARGAVSSYTSKVSCSTDHQIICSVRDYIQINSSPPSAIVSSAVTGLI